MSIITNLTNNINDTKTIQQWNNELILNLSPFILILSVYMFLGVFGNSTVLYVYFKKFTKLHEGRYFIVILAVLDLVASVVNCACHLSETILPVMYTDTGCKIERFLCMVTTAPSILVLLLIVVDRYLKICRPLRKQMTRKHKKICIGIIVIIAFFLSLPCFMFFGTMPIGPKYGALIGHRCVGVTGGFPRLALTFNVSLLTIAVAVLITMATIYSKICVVIFQKANFKAKTEKATAAWTKTEKTTVAGTSMTDLPTDVYGINTGTSTLMISDISINQLAKTRTTLSMHQRQCIARNPKLPHWRITLIFIVVTIMFALSFIPKLIMMLIESLRADFWLLLSDRELGLYMFLYSMYIFNNFINPFIYGFLDKKFQTELKKICCCTRVL